MSGVYTTSGAQAAVYTTSGVRIWGGGGQSGPTLTDLPDLIGERPVPYTLPTSEPYDAYQFPHTIIPDGGNDQSMVVHTSVLDMVEQTGAPFRGFRYWMGYTPHITWPGEATADDLTENPCVAVSNNGWEWQTPQGAPFPIEDTPPDWYWSDTDLTWVPETQSFVLYWRWQSNGNLAATSADGVNWAKRGIVTDDDNVSVSIVRRGPSDWWMFQVLSGDPAGEGFSARRSTSPLGPWGERTVSQIAGEGGSNIWHFDVRWEPDLSAFLLCGSNRSWSNFAAVSRDGLNWVSGPNKYGRNGTYRPTMTPGDDPNHYKVWHSGPAVSGEGARTYLTHWPKTWWTDLLAT